jgi:hypothetical protein
MPQGIESRLSTFTGITFTVNTAAIDASLMLTGNPDLLVNGAVQNLAYGDNCIIKGFCLSLPFQFGQGAMDQGGDGNPAMIQLGYRDNLGNNGSVNEVGDTGRINIPDFNVWYNVDIFVPQPANVGAKWYFEILGLLGKVSQIYAPAALNEAELNACFHLKIVHTLAMIA